MNKRIWSFFLGIPIFFALIMGMATGIISGIVIQKINYSGIKHPVITLTLINILILLIDVFFYFLMCKKILSKCNFSYRLTDSLKEEWKNQKRIFEILKNEKNTLILILLSFIILQVAHYFFSIYLTGEIDISINKRPFLELSYLFVPIFEEFIFRKVYFDYCCIYNVKHTYVINILVFSFAHIFPMPHIFVLATILTYCYKKYESLSLNIILHFIFNCLGIILPMFLDNFIM